MTTDDIKKPTDDREEVAQEAIAAITAVYEAYGPRALALLGRIQAILVNAGLEVAPPGGPYDMSDDVYRWALDLHRPGYPAYPIEARGVGWVSCVFEIVESLPNDGERSDGINFEISIADWDGHEIFRVAPYNYTPQVWVPAHDRAAVEERFRLLEDIDYTAILPGLHP